MKIESSIQHILNQKGKVRIPDFGTFTTAQASATVTDSGGVIAPPQAAIHFTEEIDPTAHSLAEYLVASGQVTESDVELEIEAFIKGVENTVDSSGKAGLGALGYFQQGGNGLEFVATGATHVGADSFGLPKIAARPLVPVPVTDNSPATGGGGGGDNLLLKAILIPLIILAVALAYFLIDQETYQAMKAYFGKPSTETNIPSVKDKDKLNTGRKGTETTDPAKGTDTAENTKKPEDKKTEDVKKGVDGEKPKTTTDDNKTTDKPKTTTTTTTTDTKSDVVDSKTSRFYIIIGSFTNDKAAQKKVNESKRLGYSGAKIVKMNGKIRVSIEDHDQRATAITKATKLGKDFPGAWVLAN